MYFLKSNFFRLNLKWIVLGIHRFHVDYVNCLTISLKNSMWRWNENISWNEDSDWEIYFSSKMIRWNYLFITKFIKIKIFSKKYFLIMFNFHLFNNFIYSFDILMIIIILITSHLKKWSENEMRSNFIWRKISLILFMNYCLLKKSRFWENRNSIFNWEYLWKNVWSILIE